jgi:glycosyltransferase involved in cell wall biosynthesis
MSRPVVIVSFSYAPRLNPRAFRWTAIAERLAANGHRVDVVTSWVPDAPASETLGGVHVHRAGWRFLERGRGGMGGAGSGSGGPATQGMLGALARRLWRGVCWPDVTANWYFPALSAAAPLLEAQPDAALVSVAPSFTSVAVGRALRRRRGGLRWVIDLGDPFSFLVETPPNNLFLYKGLNRRFERAAFRAADAVSVTNRRTAERYGTEFPESSGKLAVIPPLLSAQVSPAPARAQGGALRIVYLGTLYQGLREPDFLLALFDAACAASSEYPLELHFYGEAGACVPALERHRAESGGRVQLHGVVSRNEALAAMRSADVLVNLGNETAFQLPSKVVEYAAAGKPVVNIASHHEDSSIEFFRAYPQALNIVSAGGAPSDAQAAEFTAFVSRPPVAVEPAQLDAFLRPFRIEAIAARYAGLIEGEPGT